MKDYDLLFFETAVEYYVSGRKAAFSQFRIAGILFHHAFEMLFKSYLSKRFSKQELFRKFYHSLPKLWEEFKKDFKSADLSKFDEFIKDLQVWEEIRYPETNKAGFLQVYASWFTQDQKRDYMKYRGALDEADEVFNKIVELMEIDLFFMREVIHREEAIIMYRKN